MEWHPVAGSTEERRVQTWNLWFVGTSQCVKRLFLHCYTGYLIHNWSSVSHGWGKELNSTKLCKKFGRICHRANWNNNKSVFSSELILQGKHKVLARFKTWFIDLTRLYGYTKITTLHTFSWWDIYTDGMFSCVIASAGHWPRSPVGSARSKSPTGE